MSEYTLSSRSSTYRNCRIIVIPVVGLIPVNSVNKIVELWNSGLLTSASTVVLAAWTWAEEGPPSAAIGGSTLGGELIMDKNSITMGILEAFLSNVNRRTGRKPDKWEKEKGTPPQPIMYCLAVPTPWNRCWRNASRAELVGVGADRALRLHIRPIGIFHTVRAMRLGCNIG
jgi:hypothetical protein